MDNMQYLNVKHLNNFLSYEDFIDLCENLVRENKTTGPDQSEKRIKFTKLNLHRLKRLTKTLKLDFETIVASKNFEGNLIWVVIVEAWCGDAAQNLPYIQAMSQLNDQISLKIILRSDHPEMMQQFLTNGTESIPKLICIHKETDRVLGTWGSRPGAAQKMFWEYKRNPSMTKPEVLENIQRWYLSNNGKSIQEEFRSLFIEWRELLINRDEEIIK